MHKSIAWLTLAVLLTTCIWLAVIIVGGPPDPAGRPLQQFLDDFSLDALYYFSYINAALITVFTTALLAALYQYCRPISPLWSLIGFVFTPIYSLANLAAYLSQVFVVPHLFQLYQGPETRPVGTALLELFIHTWPASAIAALNGLAYAALAVPSIIFGGILYSQGGVLRPGGILLAVSGVLSVLALIGLGAGSQLLAFCVVISGGVFLFALVFLAVFFFTRREMQRTKTLR